MKTIKQMLITVAVLLCSATASAYNFEVDGIYYNILSMSDLTVVVTYGDKKYSGEVVIPSTVSYKSKTLTITSIGSSAFGHCDGLTSITIPNSVTSIGNIAFNNCTSLKDLRIEDGETTLSLGYNDYNSSATGEGLFYDCPLESLYLGRNIQYKKGYDYGYSPFCKNRTLKSVTIGNSVTSIGSDAFRDCASLKDLRIEDGETTLSLGYNYYYSNYTAEGLFYDCPLESLYLGRNIQYETGKEYGYSPFFGNKTLKSVTIGNSVTSIGSDAFDGCSGLTSVTIGNSVTSIGSSAFEDCSGLTSVTIPNSVTSIGSSAFEDCSGLTSVTIGNSVTSIGDYAFYYCTGLTSVTIGNSVTSIGSYVFSYCNSLASITIPNSVTSIGYNTFYRCSSLTSVTIPNSVTSIGSSAFEDCSGLTSVTIPNSVTSIGNYAFYECSSLESIYLLGETPPTVGSDNFTNKQYINMIVYVPKGTLATYQAADTWKDFWDIQEFDVTAIENVEDVTPAFEITSSGIQFTAADGKAIAIYAPNGALVEKINNYSGEEIALDKGVYILRIGNNTLKVKL